MKVLLVDDEVLALEYMEKLLNKIEGITVSGKFFNPLEALEAIKSEQPDAIFLDIEMPGISGIEMAEQLQGLFPEIHIIFVTAYSEYAVKAFDVNAIDYLVKPVQLGRLQKALLRLPKSAAKSPSGSSGIHIKTVPLLTFLKTEAGKEMEIKPKWRTSKVRSLFSFLLQHRGKPVRKEILLEQFWPELPDDKAYVQLYSAIYQVRKTLSSSEIDLEITTADNSYQLGMNAATMDIDEWEEKLKLLPSLDNAALALHQKAADFYNGDYLSQEYDTWAESERERLNILWHQHITQLAQFLSEQSRTTEAISLHFRLQSVFPYIEDSYLQLMRLYQTLGDFHAVEHQYTLLKQMLFEEFGVEPDASARAWYWNCLEMDSDKKSLLR